LEIVILKNRNNYVFFAKMMFLQKVKV